MVSVSLCGGCNVKFLRQFRSLWDVRDLIPDYAGCRLIRYHLTKMAQKAETGYIRTAVRSVFPQNIRRVPVQRSHGSYRKIIGLLRSRL